MILQILIIFLVLWMLVLRWRRRDMIKLSEKLKTYRRTLPLLGHAYMLIGSDEDRMKTFQEIGREAIDSGGLVSHWQGSRLYIVVSDAEVAEIILKTCLEKDDVMKISRLLTGNGSVFAPVSIWRPRRKFLAPTFSPKNLARFVNVFSQQSSVMVDQLRQVAGKGTFSIWNYITSYSMDAVCETTLGVQVNAQKQPEQPFLKAFEIVCRLDAARLCQPWLHNDAIYKMLPYYKQHTIYREFMCGFIDQIIKKKRESLKDEKENKVESDQNTIPDGFKTFLELLIESSGGDKGFTNLELQEETLVLVLAGTDTSAVGTAFTCVMLSRHPEVQDIVYEELQEVFGDSDRPVTAEDLPRLKYLDAVIRETLRLYPPAPVILRKIEKDLNLPSGLTLVKGCGVVVNIWAINRNPKHWGPDAEEFQPERFINTSLKHPAAFMTFSHGPRACIGYQYAMMSMKTATATMLRQYRIQPAVTASSSNNNQGDTKHRPIRLKFDVMMKDVENFLVDIVPRV